MSLLQTVSERINSLGNKQTYWVAFSGGLDSLVLLSLCHTLRETQAMDLRAIHINHQLSPQAQAWSAHCAQICTAYHIDYVERSVDLALSRGDSVEEVAREKRYTVFADCIQDNDVLLTAHHQNDQAETLLLQLFRGAGPKGLAAMPVVKSFARGLHVRPLLDVTRANLHRYAQGLGLQWVEDESNAKLTYARNFIRHEVMPLLEQRWPAIASTISRSASYCAEAQDVLDVFAEEACVAARGSKPATLSVAKLLTFSAAKQRLVLRAWIEINGHRLPDTHRLETIREQVLTAAWDRMPCVEWQGTEVRRYRDDLYIMQALSDVALSGSVMWDLHQPLVLPGIGELRANATLEGGLRADITAVSVRLRQGGEVAHTTGQGRHALKKLFQERDVPPWERDRVPLLFVGERLIGAVGYFMDADYVVGEGELGNSVTLLCHAC